MIVGRGGTSAISDFPAAHGLLGLLAPRAHSKNAEILVLRHEVTVSVIKVLAMFEWLSCGDPFVGHCARWANTPVAGAATNLARHRYQLVVSVRLLVWVPPSTIPSAAFSVRVGIVNRMVL